MVATTATGRGRLSAEQVARYEEDGYVLFEQPVFSANAFARLKAIFEEDLATYGDEHLDTIHFHDERLLEFLLADELLDLVESVVGPNIGLWSSHFISKAPRTGKATPWHEDSAYWEGRIPSLAGICTVWLAIDEATPENGSMGVIPGSHVNGFSAYEAVAVDCHIFDRQIKPELVDETKAVYFTLQPNECSLHEGGSSTGPAPTPATSDGPATPCGTSRRHAGSSRSIPTTGSTSCGSPAVATSLVTGTKNA